jgi:hypothetical protein
MKTKVLTYKADQNTVCLKNMELTPVPGSKYGFSVPDEGRYYWLVLRVAEGVYICEGTYYLQTLESNAARIDETAENFLSGIMSFPWISLLHIEAANMAGIDTAPMWARREQIKAEREQKAQAEKEAKERAAIERKEAQEKALHESAQKAIDTIKAGEMASIIDFLAALEAKNIQAHPRTIGLLREMGAESKIGASRVHYFLPKKKRPNLDKIFELAGQLAAI